MIPSWRNLLKIIIVELLKFILHRLLHSFVFKLINIYIIKIQYNLKFITFGKKVLKVYYSTF